MDAARTVSEQQRIHPLRLVIKAVLVFIVLNVAYYVVQPMRLINRVSVYNTLVAGRERLPFADYPAESYNLSILSLDQMLASHVIARPKAADEFRVVLLGDSAVWGYLLNADESQAACLNRLDLHTADGRAMRFYNLGYPKLSVVKDLLILQKALNYQPNMIVWATTLASVYPSDQLDFELIKAQRDTLAALQEQYHFNLYQWPLPEPDWTARTFWAQRREIANWLRYQIAGFGWGATKIDHVIPKFVTPHVSNVSESTDPLTVNMMSLRRANEIVPEDLSFDVMKAGIDWAKERGLPVLVVNEPIYRSATSQARWNMYYPKWAYDGYREALRVTAEAQGWPYVDKWDAVPPDQFTDTDFHMTATANCEYAASLSEPILQAAE
jgi:hypothetical protein